MINTHGNPNGKYLDLYQVVCMPRMGIETRYLIFVSENKEGCMLSHIQTLSEITLIFYVN